MEIEHHHHHNPPQLTTNSTTSSSTTTTTITISAAAEPTNLNRLLLLLLNILLLTIGATGSSLIVRVYFLHGGDRKWFSAFLLTAAFPLLLLPLLISFLRSPRPRRRFFLISPFLLFSSIAIGLITGVDNLLFSYGLSYLPVSTSSLLISTQLGFTAAFAFFIVKQKFTASSVNAVALLTFGAVVLGVHSNGDRPEGESMEKYNVGFIMTLAAAAINGLVLPLVELMYAKSKMEIGYTLVMEIQFVIGFAATAFCAVGMIINRDFQAISRESQLYGLGETKYYLVVVFTGIITLCFVGLVGTIKYSSALLGGVILAICIPITEVLAVIFFDEKFDGEKGVAVALCLWGTASYFYGEYGAYRRGKAATMKAKFVVSDSV